MDLTIPNEMLADHFTVFLDRAFAHGWGPFTAVLGEADDYRPDHVPEAYVVRRYRASLSYGRDIKPWTTIAVEVGRDEVGGVRGASPLLDGGFIDLFRALGLPDPLPVPVFPIDYQVAQKLHACADTTRPNYRAHDLIDLQLLLEKTPRSERRALLLEAVVDTFRYRQTQWPVTVVRHPGWETIYAAALEGVTGVETDLDIAIAWANELITDIGEPLSWDERTAARYPGQSICAVSSALVMPRSWLPSADRKLSDSRANHSTLRRSGSTMRTSSTPARW
jgi:hypothetical protein